VHEHIIGEALDVILNLNVREYLAQVELKALLKPAFTGPTAIVLVEIDFPIVKDFNGGSLHHEGILIRLEASGNTFTCRTY
jgi:hypothetical protein